VDNRRFDELIKMLTSGESRRGILRGLTAATLGLATIYFPGAAEGRKKRRKRKKGKKNRKNTKTPALQLNDFQCVDVGNACRGDSANCCSGVCEGNVPKQGKEDISRCVAHNVGECQAEQDACRSTPVLCGTEGHCQRTTGKASFCGSASKADAACSDCSRDTECEEQFGKGAACVVCEVEGCLKQLKRNICVPAAA
jgi:hypothetical protein